MSKDFPVMVALIFAAGVIGYTWQLPYTEGLEKLVAACVDDPPGVLKIGDEHFMCQTFPIGTYKWILNF